MRLKATAAALASVLVLAGCNSGNDDGNQGPVTEAPAVPLVDGNGNIIGQVRGGDSDKGVVLRIDARNLPPGVHGLHIHSVGICEGPDFKSAGPHWNPDNHQHGFKNPLGPHRGDLPNLTVASDGTVHARVVVPGATLAPAKAGSNQVALLDADGAALVIHAGVDDYKTDPSGDSGSRIACAALGAPRPGNAEAAAVSANEAGSAVVNAPAPEGATRPTPPPNIPVNQVTNGPAATEQ